MKDGANIARIAALLGAAWSKLKVVMAK